MEQIPLKKLAKGTCGNIFSRQCESFKERNNEQPVGPHYKRWCRQEVDGTWCDARDTFKYMCRETTMSKNWILEINVGHLQKTKKGA